MADATEEEEEAEGVEVREMVHLLALFTRPCVNIFISYLNSSCLSHSISFSLLRTWRTWEAIQEIEISIFRIGWPWKRRRQVSSKLMGVIKWCADMLWSTRMMRTSAKLIEIKWPRARE